MPIRLFSNRKLSFVCSSITQVMNFSSLFLSRLSVLVFACDLFVWISSSFCPCLVVDHWFERIQYSLVIVSITSHTLRVSPSFFDRRNRPWQYLAETETNGKRTTRIRIDSTKTIGGQNNFLPSSVSSVDASTLFSEGVKLDLSFYLSNSASNKQQQLICRGNRWQRAP